MEQPPQTANAKISFPGQYLDEKVILIKRRHPFILSIMGAYIVIMILLPFIAYTVLSSNSKLVLNEIVSNFLQFLSGLYFMFFTAMAFYIIIDYYLDMWIITDQRIMFIEQKGLFNRQVNEVRYERIQDITSEVSGFIPTYFRFGDILIQTAAESERMTLKQIPNPVETRKIIAEAYKKATEINQFGNNIVL